MRPRLHAKLIKSTVGDVLSGLLRLVRLDFLRRAEISGEPAASVFLSGMQNLPIEIRTCPAPQPAEAAAREAGEELLAGFISRHPERWRSGVKNGWISDGRYDLRVALLKPETLEISLHRHHTRDGIVYYAQRGPAVHPEEDIRLNTGVRCLLRAQEERVHWCLVELSQAEQSIAGITAALPELLRIRPRDLLYEITEPIQRYRYRIPPPGYERHG